jgi:hypothetical protein
VALFGLRATDPNTFNSQVNKTTQRSEAEQNIQVLIPTWRPVLGLLLLLLLLLCVVFAAVEASSVREAHADRCEQKPKTTLLYGDIPQPNNKHKSKAN